MSNFSFTKYFDCFKTFFYYYYLKFDYNQKERELNNNNKEVLNVLLTQSDAYFRSKKILQVDPHCIFHRHICLCSFLFVYFLFLFFF